MDTLLVRGREAAGAANWDDAYRLLEEADATQPLDGPDLALLAGAAYATGHVDVTIDAWERAHASALRAGDRVAAAGAAVRVALHLLLDTALMAPIRGWLKRAERLLEGSGETPVHAWLLVVRTYERLLSGDLESARDVVPQALALGARLDRAAAAIARVAQARVLILSGDVNEGVELLNEAATDALSGELDPISVGVVYCEVVCALQALGHYDLAEEWTQAMERWRQGLPVGSVHGRCRVHRAEILRLRGRNGDAEREALLACDELRPYLRRELGWPLTELGRIRLRKGDLQGAEDAFAAARQAGWDAQPGLSLTYLARGDVARAAASIRDALEHPSSVPSKELPPNTELRRAPLLEAQVEIALAAGEIEEAQGAADELDAIASSYPTNAFAASAAAVRGRVLLAAGDAVGARRELEAAVHLWSDVGAPYEAAMARMALASAHRAAGNFESARAEIDLARTIFEEVDAVREAERAAQALSDLDSGNQQAPPRRGSSPVAVSHGSEATVFHREGEYWTLAYAGHTLLLRDAKGLRYLASLLAHPGRDFHALDMVAAQHRRTAQSAGTALSQLPVMALGDAGEMLDDRAKAAYRRRIAEIEADLDEARALGDIGREAQAEEEREILIRELSRAVGLGGRDRRAASAAERARVSVTRAVRAAMARIHRHHPDLGAHLERSVRTGTYCSYLPDPRLRVDWKIRND